jgi:hypothetical protein
VERLVGHRQKRYVLGGCLEFCSGEVRTEIGHAALAHISDCSKQREPLRWKTHPLTGHRVSAIAFCRACQPPLIGRQYSCKQVRPQEEANRQKNDRSGLRLKAPRTACEIPPTHSKLPTNAAIAGADASGLSGSTDTAWDGRTRAAAEDKALRNSINGGRRTRAVIVRYGVYIKAGVDPRAI